MENNLTILEQRFYKLLRRELFFSCIEIRTKISIKDLCKERNDIVIAYGRDNYLIDDIVIDFVLSKGNKVLAGIEIVDEPEELTLKKGEELLINTIFTRLGYKFFRIIDTDKLYEAARIVKKNLNK